MKTRTKTLLAATALAASGLVQAQYTATATLVNGGSPNMVSAFGFSMTLPASASKLTLSDDFIETLAVAGIHTAIIAPASGEVDDITINISAPILYLSGIFNATELASNGGTGTFSATQMGTLGGVTMVAPKANFATSGGSLTVSGISIDLASQGIFADVSGANGLASQRVRVWDYTGEDGSIELVLASRPLQMPEYQPAGNLTITGLTITTQAFDLFAQGLGLKSGGIAAMASISDYGVMTATIPEPSTYLMMGLGLVGLSWLARRHRAA